MISVNVNVPFEIGDVVEYEHEEYDVDSVTCPFCHGAGSVNFGMEEWNIKHSENGSGFALMPMIRKCKNCENGRILYVKNVRIQKELVMVYGVSVYMIGGISEISVMQEDGRIISVPQHSLHKKEKENDV